MRNKKIIHVITTIEMGGAEKQLLVLARKQIEFGLQVEIIYLKGKPELRKCFEEAGCIVNSFIANKNVMLQTLLLFHYMRKAPNPIHAHLPKSELITAITCPKKSFIVTRHNSESFWPNSPKIVSQFFSKFVCSKAAYLISISKAVEKFMISNGEITKTCNLAVVHYGFDLNSLINPAGLSELISKFNFSDGTFKIGSIGRLVDQKDYPTLLKAFKKLLINYPDTNLYIVGEGNRFNNLRSLARELEINDNVYFLGRTLFIFEFLSLIDLFVLPSKYEGFGLVLLEAMTAAKPILASNNSSIPEVLGSSFPGLFKTGNIEELCQKMEAILNDKKFVSHLVNQYPKQLGKFDPILMSKCILKIYEDSGF
jgi:glycosyltransferase involved in cell wall biosynthesis